MTKFHDFKPMFHGIMRSICLKPKKVAENQLPNKTVANYQLLNNLKIKKMEDLRNLQRKEKGKARREKSYRTKNEKKWYK